MKLARRTLLKRLAAAGLLSWVPGLPALARALPVEPLAERLAHVFAHRDSAIEVGRRYLALGLDPADAAVLAARVAGDDSGYARLARAEAPALRAALARQEREDFAAGRMVNVDGWMLSLTEARLCAIAALVRA